MEIIGVLIQSQQAAKKTNSASELETVQLSIAGSFNDVGNLDLQMLLGNLEKELPSETTTIETDNGDFPVTVTAKHGKYEIDGNGKIEKISGISLNKKNITFTEGNSVTTETLVATLTEDLGGATVIWNSSNTGVATVNQNGEVSISENLSGNSNTTEIEAKVEVNGEEHVAKCTVTVVETVVHSIEITVTPTTIRVGNTATATTKGYGAFGTDLGEITTSVTYSESHEGDTAIATVSGSTITGAAVGTATITTNYGDLSDSCTITVENAPVEIGTLGSTIHGQFIDLGVDLDDSGSTGDDWKVVYNDTDNDEVYVFTKTYLKTNKIGDITGLVKNGDYEFKAANNVDADGFIEILKNGSIWQNLVQNTIREKYEEIQVFGGIEKEKISEFLNDYCTPGPKSGSQTIYGYFLASNGNGTNWGNGTMRKWSSSGLADEYCRNPYYGLCPVAILPSDILVTSTGSGSSTVWHVVTEANP